MSIAARKFRLTAALRDVSAALLLVCLATCQSPQEPEPSSATRSYALGFTDFPSAATPEAVDHAFEVIRRDADMGVMHFDDGVPWQEALAGTPYAASWTAELHSRAAEIPASHQTYLAVTPLGFMRDGLALHRGAAGNEPLESPWDTVNLDDARVIEAFANHVENMIAVFDPDYVAYGIEVNMLAEAAPQRWPAFVTFAREVYERIKEGHAALPVFLTLQADFFHANRPAQTAVINQILPYTDFLAVSTYPFTDGTTQEPDTTSLRADHFAALHALAPGKPFAIAETAWPAEDVSAPYPVTIHASEATQHDYVAWLLNQMDGRSARFINWFFTRDYDDFWESTFQHWPEAPIVRTWKDTGMYDGAGHARPALTVWRERLQRALNDSE